MRFQSIELHLRSIFSLLWTGSMSLPPCDTFFGVDEYLILSTYHFLPLKVSAIAICVLIVSFKNFFMTIKKRDKRDKIWIDNSVTIWVIIWPELQSDVHAWGLCHENLLCFNFLEESSRLFCLEPVFRKTRTPLVKIISSTATNKVRKNVATLTRNISYNDGTSCH